jgi:ribosomal 50S subunit-recycling heat shock protein
MEMKYHMKIGDTIRIEIYSKKETVKVIAIHSLGTIDVERKDGKCFRVSGLPI